MGFDNQSIVDINSLRGEYFCPVCRTLVYPNEALQSQCTHLYCKPCLTYVVRTTNVCPYDGFLVTEESSKLLVESDNALAQRIDKTLVRCLFHKSGCSWQGPLSQCTSHCSECSFQNSPVVCNRCKIQLAHRQIQEHAQSCDGPNPQAQQNAETSIDAANSASSSQTSSQLLAQASQEPLCQAATAPPSAHNANFQVQANTSATWTTTEQWYSQQLRQYYQQYPVYDPYQQYYRFRQQAALQLQQHAPHVGGQPQVYAQQSAAIQPQHQPLQQVQCQSQANAQPQIQLQPHITNMAQNYIQERLTKLAEAQKKEKHHLHQEIIELQKKPDDIQLLELETEKSGGAFEILRTFTEDGDDVEAKKKIESLEEILKEKDESVEHLECLNQALLIKERKSNDEMQNARKELINIFMQSGHLLETSIGVKKMGHLDPNTIISAAKKKYPDAEAVQRAEDFECQFLAKITDPHWHPFKPRMVGAEHKILGEVIDEEDDFIRAVKNEWDNKLCKAVVTAVTEMNEYNPSGGFLVPELWNYKKGRKATLAECIEPLGKLWQNVLNPWGSYGS